MTMKSLVDFAAEQTADEEILRSFLHSDAWRILKKYLMQLKCDATDQLLSCDPTNTAIVAELQKSAQVCDALVSHIESFNELDG